MNSTKYKFENIFLISIAIVLLVIGIVYLFAQSNRIFGSYYYVFILISIVFLFMFFSNKIGKINHNRSINSKLFKQLIGSGFEIETRMNYSGLLGEYKDSAIRIYYDWDKKSKSLFSFSDLVIIVYYKPLVNFDNNELNYEKIDKLNKLFDHSFLNTDNVFSFFTPCFFIRHLNYHPLIKSKTIYLELDKILKLLNNNQLSTINKETFISNQLNHSSYYVPPIETYNDN